MQDRFLFEKSGTGKKVLQKVPETKQVHVKTILCTIYLQHIAGNAMKAIPYPRTCTSCQRVYRSQQSFSNHKALGNCRPITIDSGMIPIDNWKNPDIPDTILNDIIDLFDNTIEIFPALFALLYFNDAIPQNQVIKFRKEKSPEGTVAALMEGRWKYYGAADFYEILDGVMHDIIIKFEKDIDLTELIAIHDKLGSFKKRRQYTVVITQKCYEAPRQLPDINDDTTEETAEVEAELPELEIPPPIQEQDVETQVQDKKYEVFYQRILEQRYNGGHLKTLTGITDVSTKDMHIEIKQAVGWVKAYRQLLGYNAVAPRKDLRLYLFDAHELSDAMKIDVIASIASHNAPAVSLYVLDAEGNETMIYKPLGWNPHT